MTQARVSWIGARQWGRDSSDAHATSRESLITSGGRATPYRSSPHDMKSGFTFSQFHLPVTQGRVYWIGAIQWERMVAKPTPPRRKYHPGSPCMPLTPEGCASSATEEDHRNLRLSFSITQGRRVNHKRLWAVPPPQLRQTTEARIRLEGLSRLF